MESRSASASPPTSYVVTPPPPPVAPLCPQHEQLLPLSQSRLHRRLDTPLFLRSLICCTCAQPPSLALDIQTNTSISVVEALDFIIPSLIVLVSVGRFWYARSKHTRSTLCDMHEVYVARPFVEESRSYASASLLPVKLSAS